MSLPSGACLVRPWPSGQWHLRAEDHAQHLGLTSGARRDGPPLPFDCCHHFIELLQWPTLLDASLPCWI